MINVLMAPTPVIVKAAELLKKAGLRWFDAINKCLPSGEFESDVECLNLATLIMRQVDSVATLALHDMVSLPAALVIARSSYEACIKLLWMADPEDPFEREARWVAHLYTEEDFYQRMSAELARFGSGQNEQHLADTFRKFRMDFTALLNEKGKQPPRQLPNLRQMLQSLGEERKYIMYVIGCQFAHGSHHATGIYRKHLGTEKIIGEFIDNDAWAACLTMTWYSLHAAGNRTLTRFGGNPDSFLTDGLGEHVQDAINAVRGKKSD